MSQNNKENKGKAVSSLWSGSVAAGNITNQVEAQEEASLLPGLLTSSNFRDRGSRGSLSAPGSPHLF